MTESNQPKPELEIKSDADWKQKVKAEAAQLDAKLAEPPAADAAAPSPPAEQPTVEPSAASGNEEKSPPPEFDASQLPQADFQTLVTMFSTQAMVAMGIIPSPIDGMPESNLPLAKHFIDLLGVLDTKTKRNLTGHEANLLEQSLHELRMAYLELSKASASSSSE